MYHIRPLARVPGEGFHFEVPYNLELETNEVVYLWFLISEAAEASLAVGHASLDRTIRQWIDRGVSSPGGGPRVILPQDLH